MASRSAQTRSGRTTQQIFGVPLLLGIATMAGLLVALVGDGWWDTLSCAVLAVPLLVLAWLLVVRRGRMKAKQGDPI